MCAPGRQRSPRLRLHPDLRAAAREAMLKGRPSATIAVLAGFSCAQVFSCQLHARRLPATPLTVQRFKKVAEIVDYAGPIFLEEEEDTL